MATNARARFTYFAKTGRNCIPNIAQRQPCVIREFAAQYLWVAHLKAARAPPLRMIPAALKRWQSDARVKAVNRYLYSEFVTEKLCGLA